MLGTEELARLVAQVEKEMKDAAKALQFEKAALLRDQLVELRRTQVEKKVAV
jgi:excinuclease ABC subunit B